MKRIHLYYDGFIYSVAGRELDELKSEIEQALTSGSPHWLKVNHGEGTLREAQLLIAPGVGLALSPMEAELEDRVPEVPVALPGVDV